ncbi:MAG: PIN domain-containing protein [Candidatus Nitrosotenuis sp.]|uniref:Putative PilT protein domain protein n=1 Tax=Candidatus Nitrosotenuis uzonensis TaxID=1407055 RepID=A0A812EX71_9ARCH|nr:PIN domain-containing protein [Candidatus Nitrosotenuis uzonensis]MCA2003451.1 PIN domain-containing protein [Candidatus Nitrosotenuis sp.]CAE6488313.1 putative PilT protein domain protein [Candidatus Nitrosotenuis uzonensis]
MAITLLIDTNIILNAKNSSELHSAYSSQLLDMIEDGLMHGIISTVSIAELCTGYYSQGDVKGKEEFLAHLISNKSFEIIDLSTKIADTAAKIRSETGLRLPDAIIIATGLTRDTQYFVTNDKALDKASRYLQVISAKDLLDKINRRKQKR